MTLGILPITGITLPLMSYGGSSVLSTFLAIGLLQGFVTAGWRVPDDMAIVGYDDIAFAAAAAVPLSSVRQPRLAIGYRAAELLFEEIQAIDNDVSHEHQQVKFEPELVVRRSSAKSRQRHAATGS